MAVKVQLVPGRQPPHLLDLAWDRPLAEWPDERFVRMPRGISRHVVRFVREGDHVYALKEMSEGDAEHEYAMLRRLALANLPVVEAVGLVLGREAAGERLDAVLLTRYLDYSLPYRYLFGVEAGHALAARLIDAAVVLLARLHLDRFVWNDCSLSNLLFRRDAGALMAYLVDAETAQQHATLSDGVRRHDVDLAVENVTGGLLDLQAAGRLARDIDPVEVGSLLDERYEALWRELTGVDEVAPDEEHLIEARLRRLNELGFDVGELVIEREPDARLRVRPALVEEGHHSRELRRLTGLEVQENQARRLLNDIASYGLYLARTEGRDLPPAIAGARWFSEIYEPVLAAVPPELANRLEPPELFHEFLEHRYYLAEAAGRDVDNETALRSYLDSVLRFRSAEQVVLPADEC